MPKRNWSYSAYSQYSSCPADFNYERNVYPKDTKPGNPAFAKGLKVHGEADKYFKYKLLDVPESMSNFKDELEDIRSGFQFESELKLTLNKKWEPTTWFAKDAWLRAAIDLVFWENKEKTIAQVIDWKTGKTQSEDYEEQVSLYALMIFIFYPKVEEIVVSLYYTELDEIQGGHDDPSCVFTREKHFKVLFNLWKNKIKPMQTDTEFKPSVSWKCGGCYWNKANGGPCSAGESQGLWKRIRDDKNFRFKLVEGIDAENIKRNN